MARQQLQNRGALGFNYGPGSGRAIAAHLGHVGLEDLFGDDMKELLEFESASKIADEMEELLVDWFLGLDDYKLVALLPEDDCIDLRMELRFEKMYSDICTDESSSAHESKWNEFPNILENNSVHPDDSDDLSHTEVVKNGTDSYPWLWPELNGANHQAPDWSFSGMEEADGSVDGSTATQDSIESICFEEVLARTRGLAEFTEVSGVGHQKEGSG